MYKSPYEIVKEFSRKTGIKDTKADTVLEHQEHGPPFFNSYGIVGIDYGTTTTSSTVISDYHPHKWQERFYREYCGEWSKDDVYDMPSDSWRPIVEDRAKRRMAKLTGISIWQGVKS